MQSEPTTLRLGTRGSLLARTQSQIVATALERRHPVLRVEIVIVKTTGDLITDRPLHDAGGKGLFVKELELALLAGEVDFAVHSFKDVPVTMPLVDESDLVIASVPPREDARDVLASREADGARSLAALPAGASVGTGSLRRRCQILRQRPDLVVKPIRGNIDTRLRKLAAGEYDAVVLAMAGVRRAGLFDAAHMQPMDLAAMLPAPGQGALALQCRKDADRTRSLLVALHDPATALCVGAERDVVAKLNGDCHSPIAAAATLEGDRLRLRAAVGARDGEPPVVFSDVTGSAADPAAVVDACFRQLYDQGAEGLLRADEASADHPANR